MPTWGYALLAALIAALAGYVFWPSGKPTGVAAFPSAISAPFTVTGALGEQQVADGRVRVAGLNRPEEPRATAAFVTAAKSLSVDPSRVVEGVDAPAARAWGVDASRRLVVGDEERQWGEAEGTGAVFDPRRGRVVLVEAAALRRVVLAAARLDRPELVDLTRDPAWLSADGARFDRITGRWSRTGGTRPPCDGRVAALLAALRAARLAGPGEAASDATAAHTLEWQQDDGSTGRLRLLAAGTRRWLALEGAPPQELTEETATRWDALLAALVEDRIADGAPLPNLATVTVQRAGIEAFRLERRGLADDYGVQPWWVVWPEGAEPASRGAGEAIEQALRQLAVRDAVHADEPVGPDATTILCAGEAGSTLRVVLSAGRAWCDGWSGTVISLPENLANLRADAQLDRMLFPVEAQRVVKLQRRWSAEPGRDEVLIRASGGSWARSWPTQATPVDADATARLVRALARTTAERVRRTTPEDRAVPWQAELAVRIAPVQVQRTGTENDVELADTVPQERAWRLSRRDATWLAVDVTGGLTYELAEGDVETLLADLASTRLFPLTPALVASVIVGGDAGFRLERRGEAWSLLRGEERTPADAVASRRLLRALHGLQSGITASVPDGGVPIALETAEGERLTARIVVAADGVLAQDARGGHRLDAAAWSQVDLSPATYLARP
jgi:hypothetical protein